MLTLLYLDNDLSITSINDGVFAGNANTLGFNAKGVSTALLIH